MKLAMLERKVVVTFAGRLVLSYATSGSGGAGRGTEYAMPGQKGNE